MSALTIARTELLRLLRERSNLFFVFVFPLLLVVLIGSAFGSGADQRVGVLAGAEGDWLVEGLDAVDGLRVVEVEDRDELGDRVARGAMAAGVVVPNDLDTAAADDAAEPLTITFVAPGDGAAAGTRALVDAVVAEHAARLDAARAAARATGGSAADHLALAREVQADLSGVEVATEAVGGDELAREFAGLGQFDLGASSQLFLFTFLTSLTAAGALIQSRQLGVTRRMLATPTSPWAVVTGFGAGRLLVALVQAAYIVVATVVLFQVDWGDPLATSVVVVAFCLVAGGAGLLLGVTMRNDSQAAGVGLGVALGMAALGGSMVPLEVFPAGLRTVAHVTPHAWANEAMAEIVRRDGGLAAVGVHVAVLLGAAAVLYGVAVWRLRRTLAS